MQEAVYRHARDLGFKVIIDGEGADDLMGAYYGNLASTLVQISREYGLVAAFRETQTFAARTGLSWSRLLVKAAMVSVYKQTTMGEQPTAHRCA